MTVRPLLGAKREPLTRSMGFIEAPVAVVADALADWRRSLQLKPDVRHVHGSLGDLLDSLLPLTIPYLRELLIPNGQWTAYFANGVSGTDEIAPVSQLARRCGTSAVGLCWQENPASVRAVAFSLFGPVDTDFLNHVRAIQVSRDGERWYWSLEGLPQAFEEPDRYTARNIRDRFTPEMLARYCEALGFAPFDELAYRNEGTLVEARGSVPLKTMSLKEARAAIGLG